MPNLRLPVDLRVSNLRFRVLLLTYAEVWPLHESVKHICTTDHLLRSLRVDGWLRTSAKQRDGSDRLLGSIASLVYRLHSLIPEASEWRSSEVRYRFALSPLFASLISTVGTP